MTAFRCAWRRRVFLPGLALFFTASAALAQSNAPAESASKEPANGGMPVIAQNVPDDIRKMIAANPEAFTKAMLQRLYQISPDGIATQSAIERDERVELAKQRAGLLVQLLTVDLDGDGSISESEVQEYMESKSADEKARFEAMRLEADGNKDRSVAFEELLSYGGNKATAIRSAAQSRNRYNPMLFDRNGDGRVDSAEITERIKEIVVEPTAGRSGSSVSPTAAQRMAPPNCQAPTPAASDEVVLLSVAKGAALSTVAANGVDTVTSVVAVTIERGDKPLYVFAAAAGGVIWKVDGAVDRVERFVVQPTVYSQGPYAGTGVVGLDSKVVSFVGPSGCIKPFWSESDGAAIVAKSMLETQLKRPVNRVVAAYQPKQIAVPSGIAPILPGGQRGTIVVVGDKRYEITANGPVELKDDNGPPDRPPGVDSRTWSDFHRDYPAGVRRIDPAKVLAPAKVESYGILPSEAGLIQLMEAGAIQRTRDGFFLILKPVDRFPPILGSDSRFILKKGVPIPATITKDVRLLVEETGECIGERGCPR